MSSVAGTPWMVLVGVFQERSPLLKTNKQKPNTPCMVYLPISWGGGLGGLAGAAVRPGSPMGRVWGKRNRPSRSDVHRLTVGRVFFCLPRGMNTELELGAVHLMQTLDEH